MLDIGFLLCQEKHYKLYFMIVLALKHLFYFHNNVLTLLLIERDTYSKSGCVFFGAQFLKTSYIADRNFCIFYAPSNIVDHGFSDDLRSSFTDIYVYVKAKDKDNASNKTKSMIKTICEVFYVMLRIKIRIMIKTTSTMIIYKCQ